MSTVQTSASLSWKALPEYEPRGELSGRLVAWGDPAFQELWDGWIRRFGEFHPGLEPDSFLRGTSTAVGGLYTGVADIGLFGREIRKLERTSWKRIFDHQPEGFAIATGAFDTFAKTVAVAVLVNAENPIAELSFSQLDAIYSAERRRGCPEPITRWGQLGLTGEWTDAPIHAYGLDRDTGTAQHIWLRVLQEGPWSDRAILPEGAPTRMYAGSGGHAAEALVTTLENDRYGIGLAGFRNLTGALKAVPISEDPGPAVAGTRETTASREYPLSRSVYAFVREAPHSRWDPKVKEFMRFVFSREGQSVVAAEGDYLPLPESIAGPELERLMNLSSPSE
ncbi:phosphate-binding protein PstS [Arthrobacter sp. Hiyo1]|uniref:PstS family phosphate ABC transporter substrate-binding protein n=1 Tax=Arthrobacter sp. Hiyo1 TaxID=1588020 RepID=UPI0006A32672|nr:substrate-binding domain-containing protein [Arthrobacter sp. Hiyo1]GAP60698.1 phosphate-binding protein PstS [Arthrobacter sp. Hiyo1]